MNRRPPTIQAVTNDDRNRSLQLTHPRIVALESDRRARPHDSHPPNVHVARPEVAPQLLLADQGLDEAILHHGPPQEEQEAARRHEPQEEGQDDAQEGQQRGDGRDEVRQAPEEEGHRHERGSRRRSRDPAGSHSPKKVFNLFDGRGVQRWPLGAAAVVVEREHCAEPNHEQEGSSRIRFDRAMRSSGRLCIQLYRSRKFF